jgi:transcriptional regulator with XRE-family HTH domain
VEYDKFVVKRLTELRQNKGVSARDMSLSMGQNVNYVNHIENGKMLPSMQAFFYLCEYLNISPQNFFDFESSQPEKLNALIDNLKKLDDSALDNIAGIVEKML